jgi:hypothetical protein
LNPINIIDKFNSNLNSNPSSTWNNPFPSLEKKSLDSGILVNPLWKFSDSNALNNHGSNLLNLNTNWDPICDPFDVNSWSNSGSNLGSYTSGASSSNLDTDWNFKWNPFSSNQLNSFNSNNFNSNPLDDSWSYNSYSSSNTYNSNLNSYNLNSHLNSYSNWRP